MQQKQYLQLIFQKIKKRGRNMKIDTYIKLPKRATPNFPSQFKLASNHMIHREMTLDTPRTQ